MNGKLYIKKFIRDDGETLSFDAEEIYLSENNTLLVRSDPATTAVEFTEEDGGEMIRQRGATYSQPVSGLIVPKSTEYWALCVRLSRFFILNHTYKIVYIKRDGSMFSMNRAWINAGLQIVPVPYENYSTWTIEFRIGDNFWTEYAEDSQGKEIYSNSVELPLLTAGTGGEVWSDAIQQTLSGLGNYFAIDGTSISASINKLELKGDTYQQTYSGANLYNYLDTQSVSGSGVSVDDNGWITATFNNTGSSTKYLSYYTNTLPLQTETDYAIAIEVKSVSGTGSLDAVTSYQGQFSFSVSYGLANLQAGSTYISTRTTKSDFTEAVYSLRTVIGFAAGQSGSVTFRISVLADTSITPETFVYQPYTGGIPAPNPDYPQDIHVVTGEQTINVRGVNMFNVNKPLENKYLDNSGGWATATYSYVNQEYIVTASSKLSFSYAKRNGSPIIRVGEFKADGTFIKRTLVTSSLTLTLDALTNKIIFSVDNLSPNYFDELQIELGSSPTSYQPYTSQSYTVDLGSIELCKIGNYQDYIYKSGDDWYVHKETNAKSIDGTEAGWGKSGVTENNAYYLSTDIFNDMSKDGIGVGQLDTHITPTFSRYFVATSSNDIFTTGTVGLGFNAQPSPSVSLDLRIGTGLSSPLDTVQLFKDWLGVNKPNIYYVLATPTDTKITDATLITQLNALAGAQAYNGKTVYRTNSVTMPAILSVELLQSVGGGEVWDNVGAVWEEGVGGVQTINVETTQITYPVWTVTGPCSNPTLQNDTTDTIASFDGMIASGQTLTVDFADNTAYLDSAPVAKYVSGYVSLAPGENVIGFNSDGGSTQTSTISWDNIIN